MKLCRHCEEALTPEEEWASLRQDLHRECAFRLVSGSADHILRGPHEAGTCLPDEPHLTRREAARAAMAAFNSLDGAQEFEGVM